MARLGAEGIAGRRPTQYRPASGLRLGTGGSRFGHLATRRHQRVSARGAALGFDSFFMVGATRRLAPLREGKGNVVLQPACPAIRAPLFREVPVDRLRDSLPAGASGRNRPAVSCTARAMRSMVRPGCRRSRPGPARSFSQRKRERPEPLPWIAPGEARERASRAAVAYGWMSAPKAPRIGPRSVPTPKAPPVRVHVPIRPSGPSWSAPTNMPLSAEARAAASSIGTFT